MSLSTNDYAPAGVQPASQAADQPGGGADSASAEVIDRIGRLTQALQESLADLGFDKSIEQAAASIPDTCDRLDYVMRMTEQAAERALHAVEQAKPLQEEIGGTAADLQARWDAVFAGTADAGAFRELAVDTRAFLSLSARYARLTSEQLAAILMAQDYQDLTGQVPPAGGFGDP